MAGRRDFKEHLISPGIGQREKVVEKRMSLRGEHGFRIKHETYKLVSTIIDHLLSFLVTET